MNWAYLHLVLNHIPVIGTLLGCFLLVVAMFIKSAELKRVSLGLFILMAVLAIPVYFTGEPAEGVVEHLPGIAESVIEQHEDAALFALGAVGITGVVALVGFFLSRGSKSIPGWLVNTVLLLSLMTSGLMARTANLGGKIRHTEIQTASSVSTNQARPDMSNETGTETHEEESER